MGVITYNGLSSADFGILVEHPPGYQTPERDYEYIHVPGRNGDLIIDKGSYKNGVREYEIAFGSETGDYATMASQVSKWLHSANGYARLTDTYEPNFYRLASFVDEAEFENILFHAGRATISFNCKPQRYYTSGETTRAVTTKTSGGAMVWQEENPSFHAALPYIKITGSGTITVNVNGTLCMTVSDVTDYVEIDSDIQDVYKGTTSLNAKTTLANGKFPMLINSSNYSNRSRIAVTSSGTLTKVEVIPRWWTL